MRPYIEDPSDGLKDKLLFDAVKGHLGILETDLGKWAKMILGQLKSLSLTEKDAALKAKLKARGYYWDSEHHAGS